MKKVKGAAPNAAKQGQKIRGDNRDDPKVHNLSARTATKVWSSPNTKQAAVSKKKPVRPVDLKEVYQRMDSAKGAIMFLVFLPGPSGVNNIIGEAADIAKHSDGESVGLAKKFNSIADKGLFVMGAISDPTAMPDYKLDEKGAPKRRGIKLPPLAIWWPGGDQSKVAIIRAAAVRIPFGNLRPELLTAGHAIIHDKIIVIDPLDEKHCTVITGSHNFGYKASS